MILAPLEKREREGSLKRRSLLVVFIYRLNSAAAGSCLPPPAYATNNNPAPSTGAYGAESYSNGYHHHDRAAYSGVYTASSVIDPSTTSVVGGVLTPDGLPSVSAVSAAPGPPPGYTSVIVDATHHQQYLHHHHHHPMVPLGADFPVH